MKLLRLLVLLLPISAYADYVQYTFGYLNVQGDQQNIASFIAPNFLPSLPPRPGDSQGLRYLNPQDFLYSPCSQINTTFSCWYSYASFTSQESTFGIEIYNPNKPSDPDYYSAYYNNSFSTDFAHVGTFTMGNPGNPILTVSYTTAATTYAPEPRSWLLLLAGLIAGAFWKRKAPGTR